MIHTDSEKMKQLLKLVERFSPYDNSVHIYGEKGLELDKENMARHIHNLSKRQLEPFVIYHCGVLKEEMEISELFGDFNLQNSNNQKIGLLELANNGTIYLENVNLLSLESQKKLAKFIDSKSFSRKNNNNVFYNSDVRIITSSIDELNLSVQEGTLSEELIYKINLFNFVIPPIRQRKEDIKILVEKSLNTLSKKQTRLSLSQDAISILTNYEWPNNTEEINRVCSNLVHLESDVIKVDDLPSSIINPTEPLNLTYKPNISLYEVEKSYILKALSYFNDNKTKTAQALGITIKTLYNKLHEYEAFDKIR